MRKLILFLLAALPIAAQALFFYDQIPMARISATKEQKLLVVQFSAKWCAPCQIMEENTWPHPDVEAYCAQNCVVAKIDIESIDGRNYAREYGIKSIPTTLVFNIKGEMVGRYENSFSAARLVDFLKQYDTPENRVFETSAPNLQDYLTAFSNKYQNPSVDERKAVAFGNEMEMNDVPSFALIPIYNTLEEEEINSNLYESIVYARSVGNVQCPPTHQLPAPVFPGNAAVAPAATKVESTKTTANIIKSNRFGVQTGAFSTKQAAEVALQSLRTQHHLDGTILPPTDNQDNLYRVIIGDYIDKSDADKIAEYLRKSGNQAWARAY